MTALPRTIRANLNARFPTRVQATGGLSVSKANGVWTFRPDFGVLDGLSATQVSDPALKQIWIWDESTGVYNVLTLAGLGDALYKASSTTSLAVSTGSKTFTTQPNKDFGVGSWVLATSDANPANFMLGQVTSYSSTELTVNVTTVGGSGTHADWTIRLSGTSGTAGKSAGFAYIWSTNTGASDPGSGVIKANNATLSSVTALYLSETDGDGNALAAEIATWDDSTSTVKGQVKVYNPITPANFALFNITGANTDNGTWDTLSVTYVAHGGAFSASDSLAVQFQRAGDAGAAGAAGTSGTNAGVPYNFASSTAMADPSAGNMRLNNATLASVTAIAISANSAASGNPSLSALINTWDDSTTTGHRGYLFIRKVSASQNFAVYDITGALTDNATWLQLAVTHVVSNGSFSAADALDIVFIRTGDKGAAGAGSGDLLAANNLSDLSTPHTGFSNISIHGADVASAATVNLDTATGSVVDITGTTTITAITLSDGKRCWVRFTGALTLTHGASLVLPGAQSIVTAAGDCALFVGYAAGVVRCHHYVRADGHPLIVGQATIASGATTDLGSKTEQSLTISGTTTITSFGSSAPTGSVKHLVFSGALTVTHNGASLICPGAVNITTVAGDCMEVRHEGSGNWRVIDYHRASYPPNVVETWGVAASDETTALTTGTNKATFSLPYAFTVTGVYASVNTVSSSGLITVDINEAGTSILSTKLTIDQSEKTSATAATPAVISDPSIAANAEIGIDIDGAGTGAKGLKVFIQGYRT